MPKIDADKCIACGQCVEICPNGAIDYTARKGYASATILQAVCVECGECLKFDCPGEAINASN